MTLAHRRYGFFKGMKDIDAVRKRPGMYVGSTEDGTGLHQMVFEVADNAINEALSGYCARIEVILDADGSVIVRDDGRGLPVDIHDSEGTSKAEVIMTRSSGYRMFEDRIEIPGRLEGLDVYVVNALSAWLDLRIWRDGGEHFIRFREGYPVTPMEVVGGSQGKRGTEITFQPSPRIFAKTEFDFAILERHFRALASLNAGVALVLIDRRAVEKKEITLRL